MSLMEGPPVTCLLCGEDYRQDTLAMARHGERCERLQIEALRSQVASLTAERDDLAEGLRWAEAKGRLDEAERSRLLRALAAQNHVVTAAKAVVAELNDRDALPPAERSHIEKWLAASLDGLRQAMRGLTAETP